MTNTYVLVAQTDDEGTVEVYGTEPALTYRNVNEAQEYIRRKLGPDYTVAIVPLKVIPSAAGVLKDVSVQP